MVAEKVVTCKLTCIVSGKLQLSFLKKMKDCYDIGIIMFEERPPLDERFSFIPEIQAQNKKVYFEKG